MKSRRLGRLKNRRPAPMDIGGRGGRRDILERHSRACTPKCLSAEQAGVTARRRGNGNPVWIPAFAGMTKGAGMTIRV